MPAVKKGKGGSGAKKEDEIDKNRRIIRKFIKSYEQICSEASKPSSSVPGETHTSSTNVALYTDSETRTREYVPYAPLIQKLAKLAKSEDGPPADLSTIPIIISPPTTMTQEDLAIFLQALSVYPYYSQLSFLKTNFSDAGTIILAQFLKPNPLITKLELIGNQIGPLGSKHLSRALQHNETLRTLNLDFNPIGDEGISLLSVGLAWNTCLKELSLQYCEIGPLGMIPFSDGVLTKNHSLTSIDLTGNDIGCEGIMSIGRALPNANPNLKSLNLAATCSFRDYGDKGYEALEMLAFGVEEQGMENVREVLQKQQQEEEERIRVEQEKEERRQRGEYVPSTTPATTQSKRPPKKKTVEGLLGEMYLTELNLHLNPMDKRCAERMLEMLQKRRTVCYLKLHEQVDSNVFQEIVKEMLTNREKAIKRAKLLAKQRRKKATGTKKKTSKK